MIQINQSEAQRIVELYDKFAKTFNLNNINDDDFDYILKNEDYIDRYVEFVISDDRKCAFDVMTELFDSNNGYKPTTILCECIEVFGRGNSSFYEEAYISEIREIANGE
jgi:hypothetical protein